MIKKIPIIAVPTALPMTSLSTVNSYLINTEPLTLIDSGLKYIHSENQLLGIFSSHDIDVESLERIIITHGHPDHFGMARVLQKKSGAKVFIHAADAAKVTEEYKLINIDEDFLRTTGLPAELMIIGKQINVVMSAYCEPLEDITLFSDDYSFEFRDFNLQCLHLPGHSIGHTCFYLPFEKILFSGDMVIPHITTIPVLENSTQYNNQRTPSLLQIFESLTKLAQLQIDLILPGHGNSIQKPVDLIHQLINFYHERANEIYNCLNYKPSITPYELSKKYFHNVNGFDRILALCETIVNLDYLVCQGKADVCMIDGVSHFYKSKA